MLFLPLLDPQWRWPTVTGRVAWPRWMLVLAAVAGLLLWQPVHSEFFLATLVWAALPEEWYFRAYLIPRLGNHQRANVVVALFFGLLHGLLYGPVLGAAVILPSLLLGWLFLKTRDWILVTLVHALANLFYVAVLSGYLDGWLFG